MEPYTISTARYRPRLKFLAVVCGLMAVLGFLLCALVVSKTLSAAWDPSREDGSAIATSVSVITAALGLATCIMFACLWKFFDEKSEQRRHVTVSQLFVQCGEDACIRRGLEAETFKNKAGGYIDEIMRISEEHGRNWFSTMSEVDQIILYAHMSELVAPIADAMQRSAATDHRVLASR